MSFNPYVQSGARSANYAVGTGTASIAGVTLHSLLVMEFHWLQDSGTATPPTPPSPWQQALAVSGVVVKANGSYRSGLSIWYKEDCAAGAHSCVMTPAAGAGSACVLVGRIHEYATGVTASGLDKVASSSAAGSSNSLAAVSGTTAATAQANELVLAFLSTPGLSGVSNTGVSDPSGGYTSLDKAVSAISDISTDSGWLTVSATGAQSTSWTWTTPTGDYAAGIVTFKTSPPAAPVLSLPTSSRTGNTVTLGATTDTGSGRLYAVITTSSLAGVTAAQVEAGQNAAGSTTGVFNANVVVSSTGAKTVPAIAGLPAGTYSYALAQSNVGIDSNVVQAGSLIVPAVPAISGITPNPVVDGSTAVIAGTGFGGSQGAGHADITAVAQAIGAWAATSITETVAIGANAYGVPVTQTVTDNAGDPSPGFTITAINPPAGFAYVNVGTPDVTAANRITSAGGGDLATGDQVEWGNLVGTGAVTVNADGSFVADPGVTSFDARVWTSGSGWGTWGTQTLLTGGGGGGSNVAVSAWFGL